LSFRVDRLPVGWCSGGCGDVTTAGAGSTRNSSNIADRWCSPAGDYLSELPAKPGLSLRILSGYDVGMVRRIVAIAAWAVLIFIISATISPIGDRPSMPASTTFQHLAAFAALGALFCLAYPRQIPLVCLIVLGSALSLELVQMLTPDRHGRVQDAIEKISGGAAGIMAGRAILRFEPVRRWFQS
jgi:peptidoglycan/LPS O-acetylase OafA/YrhL